MGGPWYAALPDEAWPQKQQARDDIMKVLPDFSLLCRRLHQRCTRPVICTLENAPF